MRRFEPAEHAFKRAAQHAHDAHAPALLADIALAANATWIAGFDGRDWGQALLEEALAEAVQQGVRGPAITPFVLARLHERSGGRTLRANRELIIGNAALAGDVAVALSAT